MESERTEYPVFLKGELTEPLSRWLWLIKWILVIPHVIVLIFLWIGFAVAWIFALLAIVFTGRYPRALFDYNAGVLRWTWRVAFYSYNALGTDRYPPFTLRSVADYPADLQVSYPERLSRGLALVKWWLLAIPHYIVVSFFQGGPGPHAGGLISCLAIFGAVVLLFTGRFHRGMFEFLMGLNRWTWRVTAYVSLMTDEYPPFRLDLADDPGPR
jgi:Na+/H+ antiporter NhaC